MIGFRVKVKFDLNAVLQKVRKAELEGIRMCALMVEAEAKKILSEKGHGAGTKTPSPPGSPPATVKGGLKNSISHAKVGDHYISGPTTIAWYGRIHEFGTRSPHIRVTPKMRNFLAGKFGWHLKQTTKFIKIPKRPFMRPAMMRARGKLPKEYANGFKLR